MKLRVFYLVAILIAGLSVACTNDEPSKQEDAFHAGQNDQSVFRTSAEVDSIFTRIVSINNTEEQISIASAFSPRDIAALWACKLDRYAATVSLTRDQANFLSALRVELSDERLYSNTSKRIDFIANRTADIEAEAKSLFGQNEGWYLLHKFENIPDRFQMNARVGPSPVPGPNEPLHACGCEKNSNCKRLTGLSWIGLSWENGTCHYGGCYVESWFGLWESSNNGVCQY